MVGEGPVALASMADPARLDPWTLSLASAAGGIGLLLIGIVLVRVLRGSRERPLRARDVFHMPQEVDAFVVVQLLRTLNASDLVRLNPRQRSEMEQEIETIQASCFNGNAQALSQEELRSVAKRWLRAAC
jgi:hypothetical protein